VKKLLIQLDTSPHPSVFDRVVAFDGGADEVMSYGGVTEDAVRDLVHGAIFTRGPKDLHNTAIFIGGTEMVVGDRLLSAVRKSFFGPMRVSVMLDSNGANTTAVAAVMKLHKAVGDVVGRRVVITAGTGPVGLRAAGLLVKAAAVFEEAELLLNTGPAGVTLVPRRAWAGGSALRAAADLNAVPPPGIEGIEANDDGTDRDGVTTFGALGVGKLKMKIHKASIARLFERNDLVLDAETIADAVGGL
jgi:methylenetetrahydrofolate/methylenetetrahydromethanopterin dehydrogenase (NADP+)